MRDAFARALQKLAAADKNLYLITGDLGFGVLKPFWEAYPDQFINAGIAEQAMTGMAAGMALEGKTVFTYSIGNFPTLRCLEQIRNDCAYHRANVKIVCVGGGFVYGALGMSHHATEDMAVMRALPEVCVFTPGDPYEVEAVMPVMYAHPGTCYLRLGRGGEPRLHPGPIEHYRLGQAIPFPDFARGEEAYLLCAGGIMTQALEAVKILKSQGISCGLYSFPTIKPLDTETVCRLARRVPYLFTVEEHTVIGGLGGAVSEEVAGMAGGRAQVIRLGLKDAYSSIVGDQQYLREQYHIDGAQIAARVKKVVRSSP